jgi:uncharacterized membrane protein YfcA
MEVGAITILTLVASFIGTLTGFGAAAIMVPALALIFPIPVVLLFTGIVHWFGNLWKVLLFKNGVRWKLIFAFTIPGAVASYYGARLVFSVPAPILSRALGIFLVAYVLILFTRPSLKLKRVPRNMFIGGTLSGFFSGIFGVGGTIRAAFLSAFRLKQSVYLASLGLIGLAVDGARVVAYMTAGAALSDSLETGLLLFVPVSLLGAIAAKGVLTRMPQRHFHTLVTFFLFIVGVKLLLFP